MIERSLVVTLSWRSVERAAFVGVRQVVRAREHGMAHRDGGVQFKWAQQITGFIGEMAVAAALGRPFEPDLTNFTKRPDVGEWEVRTTDRPNGLLGIHWKDANDRKFVHVKLLLPGKPEGLPCEIVGWQYGQRGKMLGLWQQRWGGWNVPECHLNQFDP